jgi:phosphatidylinositol alpha 1,6-mannosyltransferase
VLREAGASGVPVVAPRSGGAAELVRNLETGLLYDPDAPSGLAEAVSSLAADPRRGYLGARARELAFERDWTTATDELLGTAPTLT